MVYPGDDIGQSNPDLTGVNVDSVFIKNVIKEFKNIPTRGQYIRIDPKDIFDNTDAYKKFSIRKLIDKLRKTHFQGVARSICGKYIFISGGDVKLKWSQIFISKLSSFQNQLTTPDNQLFEKGPLGSNVIHSKKPPPEDELFTIFKLKPNPYWHAGGISVCGEILVVPIEDSEGNKSQIRFYNVKNPEMPIDLGDNCAIYDPINKAGAASMVRLKNGHFLVSVWIDDNDYDSKNRRIAFYYSISDHLLDGFKDPISQKYQREDWPYKALHTGRQPQYQSIQLLLQDDGKLYMIGTENSAKLSPVTQGKNRARLYQVKFGNQSLNNPNFRLKTASVSRPIKNIFPDGKIFGHGAKQYNFDAACGVYITPEKQLAVYPTHHWKNDNYINIAEFYPRAENKEHTHEDFNVVELYEKKEFKGKVLTLYGLKYAEIPDYEKIEVESQDFCDKVRSVRFKLVKDQLYELYEDKIFNNGNPKKNVLSLRGTGLWKEIPDLETYRGRALKYPDKKFDKKTSSSRY